MVLPVQPDGRLVLEVLAKVGDTCPQGWFASQDSCIVATGNKRREVIRRGAGGAPQALPLGGILALITPTRSRRRC